MKYSQQQQSALDRLDQALAQLRILIKRNENKAALNFMEKGLLKERFEEMQNIITISQTGTLGARGTGNVGTL
tara:strand:+ start:498 stop:716 length:219 start_codon:yes stop_codon:yes gene_type:complete